ncbi:hypothetical protein Tco_0447526, partial [Tanacetum coccineum]
LVEQAVQGKATRVNESNKRKWEEHQKITLTTITPTTVTATATATTTTNTTSGIGGKTLLGPMLQPQLRVRVMLEPYQSATDATYTIMVNAFRSVKSVKNWVIKRWIVESDFQALVITTCGM